MAYKAKMSLWHTRENRYVLPGEAVDLSHLPEAGVNKLVSMEAVEVVEEPAPAPRRAKTNEEGQG
jgi:hypothetical protein